MERVARIELATEPWQGPEIPFHHTRDILFNYKRLVILFFRLFEYLIHQV